MYATFTEINRKSRVNVYKNILFLKTFLISSIHKELKTVSGNKRFGRKVQYQ